MHSGGADPDRYCIPKNVKINEALENYYNDEDYAEGEREAAWYLLCHELGHAVGLRHVPDHGATCMETNSLTDLVAIDTNLTMTERGHLNVQY